MSEREQKAARQPRCRSAGGGVGVFAVQLAHSAGAHVIGTGRAWAEDLVRELGAEEFVDTERQRFEDAAGEVDVVLDVIGRARLST